MKKFNWDSYVGHTEPIYIKLAEDYGFDIESAKDIVYYAYTKMLEGDEIPTFNLGYTIVKNLSANLLRDRDRQNTKAHHVNEHYLPFGAGYRLHLDQVASIELPLVDQYDFNEVLQYMQRYLPGDDYTIIMARAFGSSYTDLAKHFNISVGQAKRRMRIIRQHLKYIFPVILE